MHLFLTSVLPFLAHDHPSAVAFLTCRHHNFHASIIPEFLSDEERVEHFCGARQLNQLNLDNGKQYRNLYNLFIQTPLMQFSPSIVLDYVCSAQSLLKSLLETKYFCRTLQRFSVVSDIALTEDLLEGLSKVQSLNELDLGMTVLRNHELEVIVNSFPSLETLTVYDAQLLNPTTEIAMNSPPPPATKTLRNLTMHKVDPLIVAQFVPHFPNLRKLVLRGQGSPHVVDLSLLSCSLLADLSLEWSCLKNLESLKNCSYLSSLRLFSCNMPDSLGFLTQENALPNLTTLCINRCDGPSTSSFASLSHAPNLQVLIVSSSQFNADCLQYVEDMVHLRKLNLSRSTIVGDSRSLKTLMQNLFQLQELYLAYCRDIGNKGAIAGALYSTHSRLRVLNLRDCNLVDDDLNGIGALKNSLEVLDLSINGDLTNEALVYCKDLEKLKSLDLSSCVGIDDLTPLKDCLNLEELKVWNCSGLTDGSFKVFSDEPNSFPNLRVLNLFSCNNLTEVVFTHLSKNNNVVSRLKELNIIGMSEILLSSPTARNYLYQLKGLRRLTGFPSRLNSETEKSIIKDELMPNLKNLDEIR